jgi:hypothetical protein
VKEEYIYIYINFLFFFLRNVDEKTTLLFFLSSELNKLRNEQSFLFVFNRSFLDDEADEEIHGYDRDELAFHHVVIFVVTFEQLFSNYDELMHDHYPRLVMKMNHHLMPD